MLFIDRIQKNPRLIRLKNLTTHDTTDYEIQDLSPSEIQQEGTEVSASVLNSAFGEKEDSSNFVLLTGTITTPEAESGSLDGSVSLNYPTGFSQNNCVILSLMAYKTANRGWSTIASVPDSIVLLKGNYNLQASLRENQILVSMTKISDAEASSNINIKVVLMKIS